MRLIGINTIRFASLLGVLTGCSSESSVPMGVTAGTLAMPLASEINGIRYRLTNDVFLLNGPERRELSHNGNGAIVFATLPTGDYELELQRGWVLERQANSGFEPLQAELTSPNPRPFQIVSEETTLVAWVFETDGVPLSLAPGVVQGVLEVHDSSIPGSE